MSKAKDFGATDKPSCRCCGGLDVMAQDRSIELEQDLKRFSELQVQWFSTVLNELFEDDMANAVMALFEHMASAEPVDLANALQKYQRQHEPDWRSSETKQSSMANSSNTLTDVIVDETHRFHKEVEAFFSQLYASMDRPTQKRFEMMITGGMAFDDDVQTGGKEC